jgi:hypothetical protein
LGKRPKTFRHGKVVPGPIRSPEGISRGNFFWVPGWSLGEWFPLGYLPRGVGFHGGYRTPWVRSAWRHLSSLLPRHGGNFHSFRIPLQGSFPKALSSTVPRDSIRSSVGDESKSQILCLPEKSVRTEVRTPLTERSQIQRSSPGGDGLQIPFDAPEATFRSGQRGPLKKGPWGKIPAKGS